MTMVAWRLALAGLVMVVSIAKAQAFEPLPAPMAAQGTVQAAFAPWNDIEQLIIDAIDRGQKQVLVQAYLLTSKKITQSLIRAHQRNVDVRVLMDAEQMGKVPASQALTLITAGVPVWLETNYQNAHNKVIVIDAYTSAPTLITGSYNYTWAAAHKNAENVVVLRGNPKLSVQYAANWERHQREAIPFQR